MYKREVTKCCMTVSFLVFCLFIWIKSRVSRKVVGRGRGGEEEKKEDVAADAGTFAIFFSRILHRHFCN